MKKILFNHASTLIMSALLMTFVIVSCKKNTTDTILAPNSEEVARGLSAKSNSLPQVSLKVTVNDATGYNITSDGGGEYINGTQNVQAVIDQYGTFVFNTNSATNPNTKAIRWVIYNFNNPVDPANTYRPSPSITNNYHFSTGGSSFGTNPFIPLQNLGVNGNPTSECIYMGNGIYNSTTAWKVSFHKGLEDVANSPTAFAVVTRVNLTQWTITPRGACSPIANVAALRNNADNFLYGYYNIPFSFTLTKL